MEQVHHHHRVGYTCRTDSCYVDVQAKVKRKRGKEREIITDNDARNDGLDLVKLEGQVDMDNGYDSKQAIVIDELPSPSKSSSQGM